MPRNLNSNRTLSSSPAFDEDELEGFKGGGGVDLEFEFEVGSGAKATGAIRHQSITIISTTIIFTVTIPVDNSVGVADGVANSTEAFTIGMDAVAVEGAISEKRNIQHQQHVSFPSPSHRPSP